MCLRGVGVGYGVQYVNFHEDAPANTKGVAPANLVPSFHYLVQSSFELNQLPAASCQGSRGCCIVSRSKGIRERALMLCKSASAPKWTFAIAAT